MIIDAVYIRNSVTPISNIVLYEIDSNVKFSLTADKDKVLYAKNPHYGWQRCTTAQTNNLPPGKVKDALDFVGKEVVINIAGRRERTIQNEEVSGENYVKEKYDWYQKFQSKKEVNQQIITDIIYKDNYFDVSFKSGKTYKIITKDISNILSKNEFKDQRVAYLPLINFGTNKNEFKNVSIGNSLIKMSKGIEIEITEDKKTLKFIQSNSFDWVLISGGDLTSWKIIFKGLDNVLDKKEI